MKWILASIACWNIAGALLRMFRIPLEKFALTRRFYPNRDLRPLDDLSDFELSPASKQRYRTVVENMSRMAGVPVPDLVCSPKSAMVAGTRGWRHHQLQLSRGILHHASDSELGAIVAHELGHIYYRHFAVLRIAELFGALLYCRAVFALWDTHFAWYVFLGCWSLLDCSYSLFRLAAGSACELMADHYAASKLNLADELSRGLVRAACFNGATEFGQITHFYPTVKLRLRLLSRYPRMHAAPRLEF